MVEDVSSSACVRVKVFPYMTVAALKQQVRQTLGQTANNMAAAHFPSLTPCVLPKGFLRVRFPPSGPALGDRSVFVHRAEVAGLLWGAEGRRYGVPVPDLCPTRPHHPPAVPAGPGRRPAGSAHPTGQRPRLPRMERLQHFALTAEPQ